MADLLYRVMGVFGYGHPIHPILTHIVIGPIVAAFVFELIGLLWKKLVFRRTAWHLTVLAFVFWFFTVAVGVIDWVHFYAATPMPAITAKIIAASVLFVLLLANIILHKRLPEGSWVPTVLIALAFVSVVVLGYFGGSLVYGSGSTSGSSDSAPVSTTSTEGTASTASNQGNGSADPASYKQVKSNGFTLEWRISGKSLDLRLSYATTGWIGVGFGQTGTMQGSDIYIGYIADDGSPVVVDSYGSAPQRHQADTDLGGEDNVTNVAGSLADGTTTLIFTVPLDSGDSRDTVYKEGSAYKVILAHAGNGGNNDTTYHGGGRFIINVTL